MTNRFLLSAELKGGMDRDGDQDFDDTGGFTAVLAGDSVSRVRTVPEPTSLVLIGLGVLTLIGGRRLRSLGIVLTALIGIGITSTSHAQYAISMNFSQNKTNQHFADGQRIGPLPADSSNWNNTNDYAGDLPAGTMTNLIDDTGTDTGTSVTWSSSGVWWTSGGTENDEHRLGVGYLDDWDPDDNGWGAEITFEHIPYDAYFVYGLLASGSGWGVPGEYDARNFLVNDEWVFSGNDQAVVPAYGNVDAVAADTGFFWSPADGTTRGNYWMMETSGSTLTVRGLPYQQGWRGSIAAVVIEDAANRLTLEVNTETGSACIVNDSEISHMIDYYALTSSDQALDCDGWLSLQDQGLPGFPAGDGSGNGWEELDDSDSSILAELYSQASSVVTHRTELALGTPFDPSGAGTDVAFQYHLAGTYPRLINGIVRFVSDVVLGDINGDGLVNGLDVDPFVGILLSGSFQVEADMDENGDVNGLDVDPFVQRVLGGDMHAVPEPSATTKPRRRLI